MKLFDIKVRAKRRNAFSLGTELSLKYKECTELESGSDNLDIGAILFDFDSAVHFDDTESKINRRKKTSAKKEMPVSLADWDSMKPLDLESDIRVYNKKNGKKKKGRNNDTMVKRPYSESDNEDHQQGDRLYLHVHV